ncbi:hypothetical protein [Fodinibius sp. Rm-B-1B1-1]|uniref:hypothetical protein n=1 Tax=Fodinibius alkaliphilus TaxID=3140241 RepID=UPI003159B622
MKDFKQHINVLTVLLFVCISLSVTDSALGQAGDLNTLQERAKKAGIEQSIIDDLKVRKESRGLTNEQLIAIIEPAVALAEDNLPANHVLQKALEGLSKGVPDAQIVPYINSMANATRQAAGVVDPWLENPGVKKMVEAEDHRAGPNSVRNRMVESSSRAINQNISPDEVSQLLSDIGDKSVMSKTTPSNIISAMDILPDLPMQDQPQLTRSFVIRALKGGFEAAEFQKLPMALNMAQKRSQIPAANIVEGIANQLQRGTPAQDILRNLFDGNIGGGPPGNIPKGMEDNPGRGNNGNRGTGNNGTL